MRRFLLIGACCAATVGCIACCMRRTHDYRYCAPNNEVRVAVAPAGGREAKAGRWNEVTLVGALPPAGPDGTPPKRPDQVRLGRFQGTWNLAAIAWLDDDTVNVCPLAPSPGVPERATVLVNETARKTFRITTDCPAFLRTRPD